MEINAYLDEISTYLSEKILPSFQEYGIKLTSFYVNDINVPEDDEAVMKLKAALSKRAEMDIVGYSYQQERSFDTLEGAATNPNSMQGGMMGAGIGLGMGVGVGGAIGQQFGGLAQTSQPPKPKHVLKQRQIEKMNAFATSAAVIRKTCKNENKSSALPAAVRLLKAPKFCPKCGKKYNPCLKCNADIPDNADICPSCGEKVPKPCPKCGNTLLPDSKFCSECGYSLVKKCPNCEKEVSENTKFCPECGTEIK